jgi:hypothetical protein
MATFCKNALLAIQALVRIPLLPALAKSAQPITRRILMFYLLPLPRPTALLNHTKFVHFACYTHSHSLNSAGGQLLNVLYVSKRHRNVLKLCIVQYHDDE